MAFSWDWLVSIVILLWIGLAMTAAVTKQTLGELLGEIKDAIMGTGEEALERGEQLAYYD